MADYNWDSTAGNWRISRITITAVTSTPALDEFERTARRAAWEACE